MSDTQREQLSEQAPDPEEKESVPGHSLPQVAVDVAPIRLIGEGPLASEYVREGRR
jgi:hypothetical protein